MKKILIIGAGFLQSFVIKRAKELGYITYAVDGNPDAVGYKYADYYETIDIVNTKACLAYAKNNKIDGVLTAATDYGVLTASYIAHELGLNGISSKAAKLIKNKYLVRKCLFNDKVDDTKQAYLVDKDSNFNAISQEITYPVMVKPCDGSGSRGTNKVEKKEDFENACMCAINNSLTSQAEIETFIVGDEYGVECFVENENIHILAIMKKWMTNHPFYAELGHSIPSGLSLDLEGKIKLCVKKALFALDVNFGSINMDILITNDKKIHIIDIGARMGGNLIGTHIIPYGTGIDYVGNMIKSAVGDPTDWTSKNSSIVVTRLLAFSGGIVKRLPDFKNLEKKYGVEIYHHLSIGDVVGEYHTNLDGCGYIIAKDTDFLRAEEKVTEVLNIIENYIF